MSFSASQIIVGTIFGLVGFVVFMYGKKQVSWKPMVGGAALMGLPYLLTDTVALCAAGALLLAALYVFRD